MGAKSEQLLVLKEEEKLLLTFRSRINDQLNRLKVEELTILSLMRKAQEEAYGGDEINLDEIGNGEDDSEDERRDVALLPPPPPPPPPRDISHLTSMTGGFRTQSGGARGSGAAPSIYGAHGAAPDVYGAHGVAPGVYGARGDGVAGPGMSNAVFRPDPKDDQMTTMEVDLGDFESGGGAGFGGAGFGDGFGGAGFSGGGVLGGAGLGGAGLGGAGLGSAGLGGAGLGGAGLGGAGLGGAVDFTTSNSTRHNMKTNVGRSVKEDMDLVPLDLAMGKRPKIEEEEEEEDD